MTGLCEAASGLAPRFQPKRPAPGAKRVASASVCLQRRKLHCRPLVRRGCSPVLLAGERNAAMATASCSRGHRGNEIKSNASVHNGNTESSHKKHHQKNGVTLKGSSRWGSWEKGSRGRKRWSTASRITFWGTAYSPQIFSARKFPEISGLFT